MRKLLVLFCSIVVIGRLSVVFGQAPTSYQAISDREVRLRPPLQLWNAAGSVITDPLFGNRILRVTDALTDPNGSLGANGHGESYHTTSAADHNTWNLDSTYFYIMNTGGGTIPFSFNSGTLTASTLPATTYSRDSMGGTTGPRMINFRAESDWSFTNKNWLYGVWNGPGTNNNPATNLHQIFRYDISNDFVGSTTNPYTQLLDLGTLGFTLTAPSPGIDPETDNAYGPYVHYVAVSFPDTAGAFGHAHGERVLALFGGNIQDYDYLIAVFDASDPAGTVKLLDTRNLKMGTNSSNMTYFNPGTQLCTTTLNSSITAGAASLILNDGAPVSATGSITLEPGTSNAETITYTSMSFDISTNTATLGGLTTSKSHARGTSVQFTATGFDRVLTTLSGAISSSSTSLAVQDISRYPSTGLLQIDNEQIAYGSINVAASTVGGLTRGVNGTTPASHAGGASVTSRGTELHGATLSKDGRYVAVGRSAQTTGPHTKYIWDLDTNQVKILYYQDSSHAVPGFNQFINAQSEEDSMEWNIRPENDTDTPSSVHNLINPVRSTVNFDQEDHTSWNNITPAQSSSTTSPPAFSANYRTYNVSQGIDPYNFSVHPWNTWDEEITAFSTQLPVSTAVWRFCHTRSQVRGDLQLTGAVQRTGTNTLTGTGTSLNAQLSVGDRIIVGPDIRIVATITSATSLTVQATPEDPSHGNWTATDSTGQTAYAFNKGATLAAFYYTPRAQVSQDGKFVIFTSNWGGSLGQPATPSVDGGDFRTDVFMVELPLIQPVSPIISAVSSTAVVGSSSNVSWTTNVPADGWVEYGQTTSYGSTTAKNYSLVTSHSGANAISVSGVLSGWHYRVHSRNKVGQEAISADSTFAGTSETVLLADDFNASGLDSSKWSVSIATGTQDTAIPVSQASGQFQIGPLLQNASGSHYNGITSVNTFDFTNAYSYVQLVQPAASNTGAFTMFAVAHDVDNFYRFYVSRGSLVCEKKIGGTKTTLATVSYNSTSHQFLRIRHDSSAGNLLYETAPASGGVPGSWTIQYSEAWNTSAVPLSTILFEMKAGTSNPETNVPGTVIFDNFRAAKP